MTVEHDSKVELVSQPTLVLVKQQASSPSEVGWCSSSLISPLLSKCTHYRYCTGWRVHSSDIGVAWVHTRGVLGEHASLRCAQEPLTQQTEYCRIILGWSNADELHETRDWTVTRVCLCPPYPKAHGYRQLRLITGIAPDRRQLVPWHLRGCDWMGWNAKYARYGTVCGWRIVGTKPYSASGSYINRMSDYCKGCHYED